MENKNRNIDDRDVDRSTFNRQDRDRDRVIENSREKTDYSRNDENRRLHFMDELDDYKVVKEDPDVRGWDVVDVNNRKVGKIDDLLVDIRREKVRYLDVDLDQDMLGKDHDELENSNVRGVHEFRKDGNIHMIVPIGLARIDRDNKRVISDDINRSILEGGHIHRKGEIITPEHERNVINCIHCQDPVVKPGNPGVPRSERTESDREPIKGQMDHQRMERKATSDPRTQGPVGDEFYEQSYFDDRRFFGRK